MSQRRNLEDHYTVTCKKCGHEEIDPSKKPNQKWLADCSHYKGKMSAKDKLSVYDIKLEIAKRIERVKAVHPSDFGTQRAAIHNQGVMQGLDSLWKWIQQSTQEDAE